MARPKDRSYLATTTSSPVITAREREAAVIYLMRTYRFDGSDIDEYSPTRHTSCKGEPYMTAPGVRHGTNRHRSHSCYGTDSTVRGNKCNTKAGFVA